MQSFPNLTKTQIAKFIDGAFDIKMDLATFKIHLRDFLIELKEFSAEDLYKEEAEQQAQRQQQAAMEARKAIPEIDDDL
ncbi:MAG: hypothetical protein SGARI_006304 [Bacillariaceae sp.]